MKAKIILCYLCLIFSCESIYAGWFDDLLKGGVNIANAIINQQNSNTRANADGYEAEKRESYQKMRDQGWNINPEQMAKEEKSRVYGEDLRKADAWDNAAGSYNKIATSVENSTIGDKYDEDGNLQSEAKNPTKKILTDGFKTTQSFIDAEGNVAAQIVIGVGFLARIADKVIVSKRYKQSEKEIFDMQNNGDETAPFWSIDEKTGKLTWNDEGYMEYIRNKNNTYVSEQSQSGVSQEKWETQYWESLKGNTVNNNISTSNVEAKRQAELARQETERRVIEERNNALNLVTNTKINGYAFDETALSEMQKFELDKVADILNKYSDVKVLLVGHTCKIGYKNINLRKGLKRAEAGKDYLVGKGIVTERILTDSKGETQPLVENTSIENRKQNRRIEIVIK